MQDIMERIYSLEDKIEQWLSWPNIVKAVETIKKWAKQGLIAVLRAIVKGILFLISFTKSTVKNIKNSGIKDAVKQIPGFLGEIVVNILRKPYPYLRKINWGFITKMCAGYIVLMLIFPKMTIYQKDANLVRNIPSMLVSAGLIFVAAALINFALIYVDESRVTDENGISRGTRNFKETPREAYGMEFIKDMHLETVKDGTVKVIQRYKVKKKTSLLGAVQIKDKVSGWTNRVLSQMPKIRHTAAQPRQAAIRHEIDVYEDAEELGFGEKQI